MHPLLFRHGSEDNLSSDLDDTPALRPLSELADDEHFSDDSLEEILPPPPPPVCNKRASIAWEVPLDDDALLTPGTTAKLWDSSFDNLIFFVKVVPKLSADEEGNPGPIPAPARYQTD